jgi:hypothetical protein
MNDTNFHFECNAAIILGFDGILYLWPFIAGDNGDIVFATECHNMKGATLDDYPHLNIETISFWMANWKPSEKGGLYVNKICYFSTGCKEFTVDKLKEKIKEAYNALFIKGLAKKLQEKTPIKPDENGNYPSSITQDLGNGWLGVGIPDDTKPENN